MGHTFPDESGDSLAITKTCEVSRMPTLTHRIAGITFRTESDTSILCLHRDLFSHFCVSDGKPDVYNRICGIGPHTLTLPSLSGENLERLARCVRIPDVLDSPLLQSSIVRPRVVESLVHPEQVVLELRSSSLAIYDFARHKFQCFYLPDFESVYSDPRIEPRFRRIFATFLPSFSATMVHSSAVIRRGKAALLLAADEGGKTTAARLSARESILSDDQVILRRDSNSISAHGTPWGRITRSFTQARLGGLFLLEKADRFKLTPLGPIEALEYFGNEHSYYHAYLTKQLKIQAFDILRQACYQAPVYRMHFPKDYVDWDAIDTAMAS